MVLAGNKGLSGFSQGLTIGAIIVYYNYNKEPRK